MDRIEVMFKEYEAVRAEILTGLRGRNTILSIGITAVGVTWTAATAWYDGTNPATTALVLVWAVPLIVFSMLWIWFGEYRRVQKAGAHQLRLEKKINDLARDDLKGVDEDLLTWETLLRLGRRKSWFDPVVFLLCAIVLLSELAGSRLSWRGPPHIFLSALVWLITSGAVYFHTVRKIRGLRGS